MFVITAELVYDTVINDAQLNGRTVPSHFTLESAKAIAEAVTNAPRPRNLGWEYLDADERETAVFSFYGDLLDAEIEALYA